MTRPILRWLPPVILIVLAVIGSLGMFVFAIAVQRHKQQVMDVGIRLPVSTQLAYDLADFWWEFGLILAPATILTGCLLAWAWWHVAGMGRRDGRQG
jgi:hypothetical protein